MQDVTSTGLAQTACVCITVLTLPTPFHLHFTHRALADTTEAQLSTSGVPLLFLLISLILLPLSALRILQDESRCCLFIKETVHLLHTYIHISAPRLISHTNVRSFNLISLIEFSLHQVV